MITRSQTATLLSAEGALAVAAVAAACGLLVTGSASAQDSGTVTVDVARCLELESEAERRDCFAARVDEVLDATAAAAPGPEPAAAGDSEPAPQAAEPARRRSAEAETTAPRERMAPRPDAAASADQAGEPANGEFFATIVEISERLPNAYIITLDNGQVWEQTEPKRYPLRPGLEVRIYRTRWGNRYRLAGVDSGQHIQVRRLR